MSENEISKIVVITAIELHKSLGPGLLESVYENSLAFDLRTEGLSVEQQVPMPLVYKNNKFEVGYRLDLLINKKVIKDIFNIICRNTHKHRHLSRISWKLLNKSF